MTRILWNEWIKRSVPFAALLVFVVYQFASFYESYCYMKYRREPLKESVGNIFWPARWKMFTGLSSKHATAVFEGYIDGSWRRIPMEESYPAKWAGAYRWERPVVYKHSKLQAPFLAAACRESGATKTRFILKRWDKVLGEVQNPDAPSQKKILSEWDCSQPAPWPGGKVL